MFGENKNLANPVKDTKKDTPSSVPALYQTKDLGLGSYTKTNKLITALYMVTDIIDQDEPLRNKLRTLGIEIVSDMHLIQENNIGHLASDIHGKIAQIMSFLEIASTINIISEMNCSILRKEFGELNQSILSAQAGKESVGEADTIGRRIDLSDFFSDELSDPYPSSPLLKGRSEEGIMSLTKGREVFKGHTRIGVQKGSTLLRAIKDMSNRNFAGVQHPKFGRPTSELKTANANSFLILKKQRRDEINNLIQKKGGNATITDIRSGAYGSLISCGEKTLQRELVSMVRDGVLNKTGEKRWSRYFLK
jgi:hypothetical protein